MSKPRKLASGRWQIRWFDVDGNRQSKTLATHELARAELRRLEVEADEDRARRERLGTGAMTVCEGFAAFMAGRRRDPNNCWWTRRSAEICAGCAEPHCGLRMSRMKIS
ncbi:MAG TPA: hypothetical protein VN253_16900 [Kofleriaceae bacterium]|nr:hypothetical protein [Kofleriaceae bacterium]